MRWLDSITDTVDMNSIFMDMNLSKLQEIVKDTHPSPIWLYSPLFPAHSLIHLSIHSLLALFLK